MVFSIAPPAYQAEASRTPMLLRGRGEKAMLQLLRQNLALCASRTPSKGFIPGFRNGTRRISNTAATEASATAADEEPGWPIKVLVIIMIY